jgi:hypothetical protein
MRKLLNAIPCNELQSRATCDGKDGRATPTATVSCVCRWRDLAVPCSELMSCGTCVASTVCQWCAVSGAGVCSDKSKSCNAGFTPTTTCGVGPPPPTPVPAPAPSPPVTPLPPGQTPRPPTPRAADASPADASPADASPADACAADAGAANSCACCVRLRSRNDARRLRCHVLWECQFRSSFACGIVSLESATAVARLSAIR